MNVPVPNANIALWIAVARTSGSSESTRARSLPSRPASAVTRYVPYVGSCADFIEHGTGAYPLIATGYFGPHGPGRVQGAAGAASRSNGTQVTARARSSLATSRSETAAIGSTGA